MVVATGSIPYQPEEFDYGQDPRVITNLDLEAMLKDEVPDAKRITFIACVGSRQGNHGLFTLLLHFNDRPGAAPAENGQKSACAVQGDPHLQPPGRGALRRGHAGWGAVLPLRS